MSVGESDWHIFFGVRDNIRDGASSASLRHPRGHIRTCRASGVLTRRYRAQPTINLPMSLILLTLHYSEPHFYTLHNTTAHYCTNSTLFNKEKVWAVAPLSVPGHCSISPHTPLHSPPPLPHTHTRNGCREQIRSAYISATSQLHLNIWAC